MLTTDKAQTNLASIHRDHPATFTLQEASVNTYLAADTIRTLREARALTQRELACAVGVTDKAVSKWESGRGLPDISLIEGLATALGVSVAELLSGDVRQNANRAGNMARSCFYVCPISGNFHLPVVLDNIAAIAAENLAHLVASEPLRNHVL